MSLIFDQEEEFNQRVLEIVLQSRKEMSYIDAVLETCEEYNIDPSVAGKVISRPIKDQLRREAIESNFFRGRQGATLFGD